MVHEKYYTDITLSAKTRILKLSRNIRFLNAHPGGSAGVTFFKRNIKSINIYLHNLYIVTGTWIF